MYGRWSFWPAIASRISGAAMLTGIEKPMPLASWAMAVLIADHRAGGVQERAAAVAGVDRRVGLDQVVERAAVGLDLAADRGHDAAGDAVRERAERAADRDDQLAHLEARRSRRAWRPAGPVASIFTIARSVRVSMP